MPTNKPPNGCYGDRLLKAFPAFQTMSFREIAGDIKQETGKLFSLTAIEDWWKGGGLRHEYIITMSLFMKKRGVVPLARLWIIDGLDEEPSGFFFDEEPDAVGGSNSR